MTGGQQPITVFLSYSWDSEEHRRWATALARALEQEPDLQVTFDQFDLWAGRDLTHFMDQALNSDRIVVVSTPNYVAKAAARTGGVGYESSIISAALARNCATDKFIPLLREGTELPRFLSSKVYIDFREPTRFDVALPTLLAAIRRQPSVPRPAKRHSIDNVADAAQQPVGWVVLPAQLQLRLDWDTSGGGVIVVSNDSRDTIRKVELGVRFGPIQNMVDILGDIPPGQERRRQLLDINRPIDREPIAKHIRLLRAGRAGINMKDQFLLGYRETDRIIRATVFHVFYDPSTKSVIVRTAPSSEWDLA